MKHAPFQRAHATVVLNPERMNKQSRAKESSIPPWSAISCISSKDAWDHTSLLGALESLRLPKTPREQENEPHQLRLTSPCQDLPLPAQSPPESTSRVTVQGDFNCVASQAFPPSSFTTRSPPSPCFLLKPALSCDQRRMQWQRICFPQHTGGQCRAKV